MTAYFTHHGPVIRGRDGKWITISLMVEHVKALTQSYLRTKARNYDEFEEFRKLFNKAAPTSPMRAKKYAAMGI